MRRVLNLLTILFALAGGVLSAQDAGERVHRVQPGETLSSIARTYLGSMDSWRVLYEANRERIANPNQIEPGLELRIPAQAPTVGEVRTVDVTTRPVRANPSQAPRRVVTQVSNSAPSPERTAFWNGPSRSASTADAPLLAQAQEVALLRPTVPVDAFHSAGWLLDLEEETGTIGRLSAFSVASGIRSTRVTAQPFDRLHVQLDNAAAVRTGDQLMAFRVQRRIKDLGRVVVPTGLLTVVALEDNGVVAEVAAEFGPMGLGDQVRMAPAFTLRAGVMPEVSRQGTEARILAFQEVHELQLLGDVMFLDVGREDGVTIGDEFVGYASPADGWEPEAIGRVQIVGVRDRSASARILSIDAPAFSQGLSLRLSRKMP